MSINILPGKISMLESMFGVQKNEDHHVTLNSLLGITYPGLDTTTLDRFNGRAIKYVCIGVNGVSPSNPDLPYSVRDYEIGLYGENGVYQGGVVPIRCVPINTPLQPSERAKYRLRKIININGADYIAYYAKVIEPSDIRLKSASGVVEEEDIDENSENYIIDLGDTTPVVPGDESNHPRYNSPVFAFVDIDISIENDEFKEWYRIINGGSLVGAKINEFGFITGKDKEITVDGLTYTEVEGAEIFSKVTTTPKYLNKPSSKTRSKVTIFG